MSHQLMGQVLSRMGIVSAIDIDEILTEQEHSRRRFGEIALAWGLCQPEHIGEAWFEQLIQEGGRVDLDTIGIDPMAPAYLGGSTARRLGVIPIRMLGALAVVAASRDMNSLQYAELSQTLGRQVRIVHADAAQVEAAIERHYPLTAVA